MLLLFLFLCFFLKSFASYSVIFLSFPGSARLLFFWCVVDAVVVIGVVLWCLSTHIGVLGVVCAGCHPVGSCSLIGIGLLLVLDVVGVYVLFLVVVFKQPAATQSVSLPIALVLRFLARGE